METRLQAVISDILGEGQAAEELNRDTATQWDSLRHLNLILALEEEFGVEIAPEDFPKLHSNYNVILDYLKQHMS